MVSLWYHCIFFFLSSVYSFLWSLSTHGFPDSSVGKESTCNAGDPGSIPWSGRSIGEGIDSLPTPVFLDFPVAQLVKNLPAMWETWV